jgi:L-fucose isomerase
MVIADRYVDPYKGNQQFVNRYKDNFPKIGIRPIIDPRKLVKAALSDMTMDLARSVQKLLEENLKYPNGQPVQCVVSDTCISNVAQAGQAAKKFAKEDVGVIISVASGWCYPLETMETNPLLPHAIWGFNGTERPGAVYLAALHAAHNQKGIPAFKIYGRHVQDLSDQSIPDDVQHKLLQFARAGLAVATLRGKSYLSIGSVSMGIAGCVVNENFFQKYLGMRNAYVDMTEVIRRMDKDIYDKEEFVQALAWVRKHCKEGSDENPIKLQLSREQKDKDWEFVVKMTLIVRDLMIGNPKLAELGFEEEAAGYHAIAAGFQGQRAWTDQFPSADFTEALLNSSFDWNGVREPYIVATENDNLNAVTMLFGHLLTNTAQVFADVRTYWSPEAVKRVTGKKLTGISRDGVIHLLNSGPAALDGTGQQVLNDKPAMKPFWEITSEEAQRCLEHTSWRSVYLDQFWGGGYSSQFLTKGDMPATISRINMIEGLGPVLQIAEGYTVELPEEVHAQLNERTTPTWPTTWFVPILNPADDAFKDVYSVMDYWGSNHCVVSYGHIGGDLITLASMLRIPVSMHNVPRERTTRPSAWSAFGTKDPEGADYRACVHFGPLYG